ncbi:MAG: hypothetical protein IS632_03045 [Thaumarchaeota archaeon]|nr:hypothetical protein [Nitrososphaerota archaeon]
MTQFDSDLRPEIERVRAIRDAVERLKVASDIKSVDERDLGDIAGTLTLLEYLISKYQERRDLRRMLEGIRDSIRQAADGIVDIDEDISEMSASSEESCRRIQETRLSMHSSPNPGDRDSVRRILAETGQEKFTPATNKTHNVTYKRRERLPRDEHSSTGAGE